MFGLAKLEDCQRGPLLRNLERAVREGKKKKGSTETHAELGEHTNGVSSTILDQRTRNDFHGFGHGSKGPALNALNTARLFVEAHGNGHLGCATSRGETRVKDDIAGHGHGVGEVAINFVENILGGTSQENGAGLGVLALGEECKVTAQGGGDIRGIGNWTGSRDSLVAQLVDVEESTFSAHIRLAQVIDAIHNGGPTRAGDAIVVGFAHAANGTNGRVGLEEIVLREVCRGNELLEPWKHH